MIPTGPQATSPEGGKSKIDKKNFMFVTITGQEVMKKPGEVNGNAFKIAFVEESTVWVLDNCSQVHANFTFFRSLVMNVPTPKYSLVQLLTSYSSLSLKIVLFVSHARNLVAVNAKSNFVPHYHF